METRQLCLLRLFGSITLESPEYTLNRFETKRSALILARVALARDQRIGRDELAETLWPDEHLDLARVRLRQELLRLRNALGPLASRLRADRHWVELEPGFLLTDVKQFEDGLRDADAAQLEAALAVVTGPFLAGFQDPWAQATRRVFQEKAKAAWLDFAVALDACGQFERGIEATNAAVALDPLDAASNGMLIQRLVARGQNAAARQAYESFDALMVRELGSRAPSEVAGFLPADSVGVVRPSPIYGREQLINRVVATLARPGSCVVLIGLPGVGKTHLAQEAAWRFSRDFGIPVQTGGVLRRVADGLLVLESADRGRLEEAMSLGWRVLTESRSRLDGFAGDQISVPMLDKAAVRILSPGVVSPAESDQLVEIAERSGGYPLALRYFADRLGVVGAGQILESFDAEMDRFLHEGSVLAALQAMIRDAAPSAIAALRRLAEVGDAEASLASRLAAVKEGSGVWRALESRGLVSVSSVNGTRRFSVPAVVRLALTEIQEECCPRSEVLRIFADWVYEQSKVVLGAQQVEGLAILSAELPGIRAAMAWATDREPALAAYFAAGIWRTVASQGLPYSDGDLCYAAAEAGAHLLEPRLGGEAWTGAAIVIAITRRLEPAMRAYEEGIRIFGSDPALVEKLAWAKMNYAESVAFTDKHRALAILKEATELPQKENMRHWGLTDYALMLVSIGVLDESIRLAEEVFSKRLAETNPTSHARAYVDLGRLYHAVGRREAARPLMLEGIRRLREGGVQYMLVEQIINLANIVVADEVADWTLLGDLIDEAETIVDRIGGPMLRLDVSRLRLVYCSRHGDREDLLRAAGEVFDLTKQSPDPTTRSESMRLLAAELGFHGRGDYANAVLSSVDRESRTPCQTGWLELLKTENHVAACVLAAMLAREAF